MGHYQTEQKRVLLQYLKAHSDHAFTINELSDCMQQDLSLLTVPGKSSIYRIVPDLVQQGLVKRFTKGNSRQFLYQMVCGENCRNHLHLKCSICGKIFHMKESESKELFHILLENYHFIMDEDKTILFGHCEKCQ